MGIICESGSCIATIFLWILLVRAANPLVQDARFGDEKYASIVGNLSPSGLPSPSSPSCKGGCARMKFGSTRAAVRVEGFDCLNRDRQNSSILAFA